MKRYYAHTGISLKEISPQFYEDHIGHMYNYAKEFIPILTPILQKAVLLGILFHDFGKLIPESQEVLCRPDREEDVYLVNHVDAGVAWCLREHQRSQDIAWLYAAYLIHAHHIGLQDRDELYTTAINTRLQQTFDIKEAFRDTKYSDLIGHSVALYSNVHMDDLFVIQASLLLDQIQEATALRWSTEDVSPMDIRFALSILVDCDHTDTARHFGQPIFHTYQLKAEERLSKLDSIVETVRCEALASGISEEVVNSRQTLFNLCHEADLSQSQFFVCTAPTGKGKTYSLMHLALRKAKEANRKRIFFIIPFTNIISQSVGKYRQLILRGEDATKIVNEIHSKVEYNNYYTRVYSHQWNAPINVSTSVQFFESLFSNFPSAVRKLHQFANSVIVFDEYHTSLPHHLWKVVLFALQEVSIKYNIDFIFGSGTHVYYWDIFEGLELPVKNVIPDDIFAEFAQFENDRVQFESLGVLLSDVHFYTKFHQIAVEDDALKGNTLLVLNTVRNAVSMTGWFKLNYPEWGVYHMSSYLTPVDREVILAEIHGLLKGSKKILLIATSVVECGIDFSFEIGFREYGSMLSTIQFGGRVNRNKEEAVVPIYEFSLSPSFVASTENYTANPTLSLGIQARSNIPVCADNCTAVIHNEITAGRQSDLMRWEAAYAFRTMESQFHVIKNLTESIIVSPDIVMRIKAGELVFPVEINRNSVSVFRTKLNPATKNNWLRFVEKYEDIFYWVGPYDPKTYGIYACLFEDFTPSMVATEEILEKSF